MSFIDDILDFGKGLLGGDNLLGSVASIALTGYALNKISSSLNKDNSLSSTAQATPQEPDRGVRLQVVPDSNHKVPVIYGSAYMGGIITDAEIANNNTEMYYCITICEKTGIKYSDDTQSSFTFEDIYFNDQRMVFQSDGITCDYTLDREGNVDRSQEGLVEVYCFNGNGDSPVVPDGYTNGSLVSAYNVMPSWTSNHYMTDLIFAIVKVTYNKEKNITSIPKLTFHMTNDMTLPGDCVYDYMTSERYGAGIDPTEIYRE